MSNPRRASTEAALNRYYERQLRQKKTRAKNKQPEKQVAAECVTALRALGAEVQIIEAKAVYNPRVGRYLRGQTNAGTCDCFGVLASGTACFIEFKAPGRLKTLKPHQREYLRSKIDNHAFACVVDSAEMLNNIYSNYINWLAQSKNQAKHYLLNLLP